MTKNREDQRDVKSGIYLAGVDERHKNDILLSTGITQGNLPFRYLGIPLASARLRTSDFGILIDAVTAKISAWPRLSLSHAGKVELIRSVIQGIECYWLAILPLPSTVIDTIYAVCRKFVWPTKRPPIAWKKVCRPLEDGGLGLKDLGAWNKALLSKTLWKIHLKKDNLWIQWVNHLYSNYDSVWQWRSHRDASPLIKQILCIRDTIIQRFGSEDAAISTMTGWFAGHTGVRKAYVFFSNGLGKWPWKPLLTKSFILPKHRFIFWLFAHSKLLTRDRLDFATDKSCVLCANHLESMPHLFFNCEMTKSIWTAVRNWLGMKKNMGSSTAILKAFRGSYRSNAMLNKLRLLACATTIYHIWNARNRAMFEGETPVCEEIVRKIQISCLRCLPSAIHVFD